MTKIKIKAKSRLSYPRNKKIVLILTAIVLLVFAGQKYFSQTKLKSLKTEVVKRGEVIESLVLSGSVGAQNHAKLSFQGSGKLSWVGVKEGDYVKKGQSLAQLDTNSLKQQLEQTTADLRYYEALSDRVLDDVKGNDDDETFEEREVRTQAQAGRDKAYRAYEIAKQNIANAVLRSPFDGVVTRVNFPYTGINVAFTDTQVEVVDIRTAYFSVAADQTEVVDIKVDDEVDLTLDAFPDKNIKGTVSFVGYSPKPGEVGSVYEVKVAFSNPDDVKVLKVGMSGDAKFVIGKKQDVYYLPPKFVKSDSSGKYIKAESPETKMYIEIGIDGDSVMEIKGEGLKEGMKVFE